MANTVTKTGYRVQIDSTSAGSAVVTFTAEDDGWSDELAQALWAATEGLAWPPGCGIIITKIGVVTTTYDTNTSGTSLTFS